MAPPQSAVFDVNTTSLTFTSFGSSKNMAPPWLCAAFPVKIVLLPIERVLRPAENIAPAENRFGIKHIGRKGVFPVRGNSGVYKGGLAEAS